MPCPLPILIILLQAARRQAAEASERAQAEAKLIEFQQAMVPWTVQWPTLPSQLGFFVDCFVQELERKQREAADVERVRSEAAAKAERDRKEADAKALIAAQIAAQTAYDFIALCVASALSFPYVCAANKRRRKKRSGNKRRRTTLLYNNFTHSYVFSFLV